MARLALLAWVSLGAVATAPALAAPDSAGGVTLVAAGDVAGSGPGARQTASLLASIPGEIAVLGDVAYDFGSQRDFMTYYEPTWGRFKARTHPAAGNHEYLTAGASGYFDYFGARAGARGDGWYGYDLGPHWRAVVLNSNFHDAVGVAKGSRQYAWLQGELAAHRDRHLVAYWHHPRFSTGPHGDNPQMIIWRLLAAEHADLVLTGHDHDYERFYPLDANGMRDDRHGIQAFVVGTGGKSHSPLMRPWWPVTAVRNDRAFGVLKLALERDSYAWRFIPADGQAFTDAGRAMCHPLPAAITR